MPYTLWFYVCQERRHRHGESVTGSTDGQRLRPCCFAETPWFTVVGVSADVKQGGIDKKAGTEIYFSLDQIARIGATIGTMHVVVRTTAPFEGSAPFIRDVAREIDPTVPIVRLREMDDVLQESIRRPRLLSDTVSIFAGRALIADSGRLRV